DGSIVSYSWDFGDGGTSSSANPSHTYSSAGTYTVTLTVTDNDGATDSDQATVTVNAVPVGSYATLPYSTGFEGGLDQYWTTQSSNSYGRIQTTSANSPHSGTSHLVMDSNTNGNYVTNEAWLRLDLSGESQVDLSFWWKEFGDETHSQDGVYFSDNDGATFVKVQDLNGQSYTNNSWTQFNLDVDQLAGSNGLSLSSTFVIKFQQYDNYRATTDGHAIDDISVTAGGGGGGTPVYITAESEGNGSSSSADGPVGAGVDVSGTISSSSDDDWFYFDVGSTGNINISVDILGSADLDWYLYHESNTGSYVARGYTTSDPEAGSYNATQTGRYYVRVDGYNGATSGYVLTITGGNVLRLGNAVEKEEDSGIDEIAVPQHNALSQNFPNPFNPRTSIRFDIATDTHVMLNIYNVSGQLVQTLVDEYRAAGTYTVQWDGTSMNGQQVATGTYIYTLVAGDDVQTKTMTLLK
ncbi:MAG: PKD domain-containing protein, partial [Chloroflexi bacterium]